MNTSAKCCLPKQARPWEPTRARLQSQTWEPRRGPRPDGHLHLLLLQIRQVHFVEDQHVRLKPKSFLKQRIAA